MIKIYSHAHEICEPVNPDNVRLFIVDIPTRESIRMIDLQVGNTVEVDGETFTIVSVSLNHQLLAPPIPILSLKCKKVVS